jgi:hypothetical protein
MVDVHAYLTNDADTAYLRGDLIDSVHDALPETCPSTTDLGLMFDYDQLIPNCTARLNGATRG